ncbi:putative Carboxymethylenebutenolidase [Nitrospira sp. KM1]|uniref:dienelactone hydrolase family protein n=1 Tax=Nitrospira sp. KM1 TaxID=1936990 RepID=UPI0013A7A174|nr:dienelactone hydrolase family protein [Nitrospira sp. KM1]BCA57046.1 putative Carboxymethylenebutenolidase [Nitrospira sp. KM1]
MATSTTAPFTPEQIGTGTCRFPSGAAIPTATDAAVDPYIRTRVTKHVQVECIQFWPQVPGVFPGIVLLHEWWGLNSQIKDLGSRLACEGYNVIIPNLYARLGGMVTANGEVAEALMNKLTESLVIQDINSCCEYFNTKEHVKRNIHGVVGFGMGGSFALRFACQRKRLRAAVSYYGRMVQPDSLLKDLYCPVLYHQPGRDTWVAPDDVDRLRKAAADYDKRVEILTYPDAPHAFSNELRPDGYREDTHTQAWNATAAFLKSCLQVA